MPKPFLKALDNEKERNSILYFKEVNRMLQDNDMPVCPEHSTGTVIVRFIPRRTSPALRNTPCRCSFSETGSKIKHRSIPVVTGLTHHLYDFVLQGISFLIKTVE